MYIERENKYYITNVFYKISVYLSNITCRIKGKNIIKIYRTTANVFVCYLYIMCKPSLLSRPHPKIRSANHRPF